MAFFIFSDHLEDGGVEPGRGDLLTKLGELHTLFVHMYADR